MTIGRSRRAGILAAAVMAVACGAATAAPGDLDPRFGTGGVTTISLGGPTDVANALALTPDGGVVVAGSRILGARQDGIVIRLTPQGRQDRTFGGSGLSLLGSRMRDIAALPDGRLLVAGASLTGQPFTARLGLDGRYDPTFAAPAGFVTPGPGPTSSGIIEALAPQPDGSVVIAGAVPEVGDPSGKNDFYVARLTAAGLPDTTFAAGTAATVRDFPAPSSSDTARAVAVDEDGTVVAAGATSRAGGFDAAVARIQGVSGLFDTSFGPGRDGTALVEAGGNAQLGDLLLGPGGDITVAGQGASGGSLTATIARLRRDGTPDPTFSGDGIAKPPGILSLAAIARQPDGRLVAAGQTVGTAADPSDIVVVRVLPDGSPDPSFGTGGQATIDLGATGAASDLALGPDGTITVAGYANRGAEGTDIVVVRLQGGTGATAAPGTPSTGSPGAGAGSGVGTTRRIVCGGRRATIVGTPGADRLRGTAKADVIAGLAGDDVIRGLGGNDVICGGAGTDTLRGGAGRDRLLGGAGRDLLRGGPGRDVLRGGPGRDAERQ